MERPNAILLSSERVALGPMRSDLAPVYNRWRNDLVVQKTFGSPMHPVSLEQTMASIEGGWAASVSASPFTIYRHDTWQPIGITNLRDIDHAHGLAEFGIAIGERSLWNQGYGTETARLMLHYGFRILNLHVIYLTVDGANPRGRRAYEKAGFREAGRYREAVVVERERYDLIHMDCLAREFIEPEGVIWGPPEAH